MTDPKKVNNKIARFSKVFEEIESFIKDETISVRAKIRVMEDYRKFQDKQIDKMVESEMARIALNRQNEN